MASFVRKTTMEQLAKGQEIIFGELKGWGRQITLYRLVTVLGQNHKTPQRL